MPNKLGLLGDPRGEMRATPRNKLMGLLADALGSANEFATQMDPRYADKRQNQTLGLLADAVSLGSLAKTADRISYGEPLTNAGKANVPYMKPETADALMMAPLSPRNALAMMGAGMADNGMMKAATVWHGSPHKFDKFDASKIGTGEGAQAYGHGLYLAESPGVAATYRDALSNGQKFNQQTSQIALTDGRRVKAGDPDYGTYAKVLNEITALGGGESKSSVVEAARMRHEMFKERGIPEGANAMKRKWAQDDIANSLKEYEIAKLIDVSPAEGQLYKVDLPDDQIAKMLDWDKPLSQQAPEVQAAASQMFGPNAMKLTGEDIYKKAAGFDSMVNVASKTGGNAARLKSVFPQATSAQIEQAIKAAKNAGSNDRIAAQMLRDAGIPGIRYLDGGSRTAGQGSSNFVVFPGNEGLLSILERNGQPLK